MRPMNLSAFSNLSDYIFKSRLAFGLTLALLLSFFLSVLAVQADTDVVIGGIVNINGDGVAAENEVILLGTQSNISATLLQFDNLVLQESYTDLSWLPHQGDELTLALVQISSDSRVEEMVHNITGVSAGLVKASPNYIMTGLDSHIVGGSPSANPKPNATPTPLEDQWAVNFIGLPATSTMPTGDGVRVFIFDAFCNITTAKREFTFGPNICGHGVAVKHVISSIAPDADITQIEVLNDQLVGNLWILLAATSNAVSDTIEIRGSDTLEDTVWNFSLGMMTPADDDVEILRTIFEGISQLNGVVIAASGNETAQLADVPARYPFVLSVGAITPDGVPASYSNPGEVYAPGGAGACRSNPMECLILPDPNSNLTRYSYVAGTSFAAPFVSGLAALAWEEGADTSMEVIGAIVDGSTRDTTYDFYKLINISDTLSLVP